MRSNLYILALDHRVLAHGAGVKEDGRTIDTKLSLHLCESSLSGRRFVPLIADPLPFCVGLVCQVGLPDH